MRRKQVQGVKVRLAQEIDQTMGVGQGGSVAPAQWELLRAWDQGMRK